MYAQQSDPNCPVLSLKKYISKLNPKCSYLFQRPRTGQVGDDDPVWYENKVLGIHKLETMMKNISVAAGLSQTYTNHCLRATATTVLSQAGYEARNIMSVTGHKNVGSLDSYVREPSLQQRSQMCQSLHKFGKEDNSMALVPITTSNAVPDVVVPSTSTGDSAAVVVSNTQANLALTSQQSVFSGANFNGSTTINVNIHTQ